MQASYRSGSIFGDVGFVLHEPRSGTATASMDTELHCLSRSALADMNATAPHFAMRVQQAMLKSVAALVRGR